MNPLSFDGDDGRPSLQSRSSIRQSDAPAGNAVGNGVYPTAPLPERLSPLFSYTEVEAMHGMAHRLLQPPGSGARCASREVLVTGGAHDDALDINTSSASSSTTSPQWHRHNPYRTLSTATSTPAHSPSADNSYTCLALPCSFIGRSSKGPALASHHLNVVLHRHASHGRRAAALSSEPSCCPQQPSSHPSVHAHDTLLSSETSQPEQATSRTSSSASRASSHYSSGHQRNSSTGFLPDVDVVEGTTSNSSVFLMHNCQFRLNTHDRSRAASSSLTTPQSYTTANQFFEETGGFSVDDDYGTGCNSRRRSATSHSFRDDVDHHGRSGGVEGGYGTGRGAAAAASLLSTFGRCGSVSFSESSVRGQDLIDPASASGPVGKETNTGQTGASAPQKLQRLTMLSSVISLTEVRHSPQKAWPSAESHNRDRVCTMPSHADPTLTPADYPKVEQYSHAHQPQDQQHQPKLKASTDAAALWPSTVAAAAPSFTVAHLTELLEAHLARVHSGNSSDGKGRDEVWCPAGSQLSVYDSCMRQHYLIKSEKVAITRGAIKYASLNERYGNQTRFRFQLCNRYLRHRCSSASKCPYIHSHVLSTVTAVHMNENSITSGVRQQDREDLAGGRNALKYPTIAPGMIFAVYPPNQLNSSPQLIPSELILQTEGALHTYRALSRDTADGADHRKDTTIVRPRHCAHFQFKRMCNLGTSCHFIHSLIPFVQGTVNQPPLPLSVDLRTLNSSVAGVVLPSAEFDAGDPRVKEVLGGGRGAYKVNIASSPLIPGETIPPVWPHVSETAQKEAPSPPPQLLSGPPTAMTPRHRPNTAYREDCSANHVTAWRTPNNINSATLCRAGASRLPAMVPMGARETMGPPAMMTSPPQGLQKGVAVGFKSTAHATKHLPVQQQVRQQPLLVRMPSMLVREQQAQPPLSTPHPSPQRWGAATAVPPPQTTPTAAVVRRGNTSK
ncbi:hypothetical protein, conserved [Leishmania tarentolae]|uniref:C3H1-type domain-containing protein n=1 Tax=Leishmania tarentolae TaxID=5689 RepID=A0A640K8X2_LEITA|nr:hypothetical protein, conserved [Leishmania tarentolae]